MKTKTIDKLLELVNSISSFYEKCKVKDGNQYDFKIAETAVEIDGILKEEKRRKDLKEENIILKEAKIAMRKKNDSLREEIKTYQHLTKLLSDENEQIKKRKQTR
jgi:FtsZ-binding cell division protein ZapB